MAKLTEFQPVQPDLGEFGRNLAHQNPATAARRCRIPFFAIGNFFIRAKRCKIFLEKSFFLKDDFTDNILQQQLCKSK